MIQIIEFAISHQMIMALGIIFGALVTVRLTQGYHTAPDGSLIGKDQMTGTDEPSEQTTQLWDVDKPTTLGTTGAYSVPSDLVPVITPLMPGTQGVDWRFNTAPDTVFTLDPNRRHSYRYNDRHN